MAIDGDVLLANRLFNPESDDSVIISYLYDVDGELFGMEYNGNGVFAYTKNLQGDIVGIIPLDNESTADVGIEYDAWGYPHYRQGSSIAEGFLIAVMAMINAVGYRGYFFDMDTRLYYLRSRYYDPETGRFINADDIEMMVPQKPSQLNVLLSTYYSLNAYAYCENNPISNTDENGKVSKSSTNKKLEWAFISAFLAAALLEDDRIITISNGNWDKGYFSRGEICVDFTIKSDGETFSDSLDSLVKSYGSDVYYFLADVSMAKFKETYQYLEKKSSKNFKTPRRSFLFSRECVTNEIKLHFEGYMWSIGKKGYKCPVMFRAYKILQKIRGNTVDIKEACKVANILERGPMDELAESIGFDYYNGIASEYKRTNKDPYYYPGEHTRKRKANPNWKNCIF